MIDFPPVSFPILLAHLLPLHLTVVLDRRVQRRRDNVRKVLSVGGQLHHVQPGPIGQLLVGLLVDQPGDKGLGHRHVIVAAALVAHEQVLDAQQLKGAKTREIQIQKVGFQCNRMKKKLRQKSW